MTVGSYNVRQDMKEGGICVGNRRSGGWEKVNKKRRNGESTYMDGMRLSFLLIFACLTVSNTVGHSAHVSF